MTPFYECAYPVRITYMIFLIFTILTLLFLLWLLIGWKCDRQKIVLCAIAFAACFSVYVILMDDHITPLGASVWQGYKSPLPIAVLWVITLAIFALASINIMKTSRQHKRQVTEENIKEAMDEVPLALCWFEKDGIPMLCNRRMQEISEMMSGRVFVSYNEFWEMLKQKEEWRESGDIYHFPDHTVCRYEEDELTTMDNEHYRSVRFFDVTELAQRKSELEAQNEELRKMSVELLRLKENVRLLAKEEEILSIKSRWHDVMGEGLTAIRRALISGQAQEISDKAIKKWNDAVTTIQRDNDDPDQRRDAVGDLLRDASGLQIKLVMEGEMPKDKEIQQLFVLTIRNCMLNAAQHAKATELYVVLTQTYKTNIISVTNNGLKPIGEITPHGGLINVQNHAERLGGVINIQSIPEFKLKVIVPRKEIGHD